ncbi:hypothetical protein [Dipodfec virus UOA04_Rod_661]|nr:hypothetical protein [Dipodfec virus UOA04_Rod_661]
MIYSKTNNYATPIRKQQYEAYEGKTLMEELRERSEKKEKSPIIMDTFYTLKKDGVNNSLNIRADRFAIGQEEAEKIQNYRDRKKQHLLKKTQNLPEVPEPEMVQKE